VSTPLPAPWTDLEPLAQRFAAATEAERAQRHREAEYAELEALYRTLLPRVPAILEALNARPLVGLDAGEQRLLHLTLAFVEAAVAVERFQCADMPPGAFEAARFHIGGVSA
jgi:hypothetical protein